MTRLKLLIAAALLVSSGLSPAMQLSITAADSVQQGDTISALLVASDLGNYKAPTIGAFAIEIAFDDSILDLVSVEYGALLGDPSDRAQTNILTVFGAGTVSLNDFSRLSVTALDGLQPASFTLATLLFRGRSEGNSVLAFGADLDISDAPGETLTPTALNGASIRVSAPASVPIPATLALVLPFPLLLARRNTRR